jgi:hypothetical protein
MTWLLRWFRRAPPSPGWVSLGNNIVTFTHSGVGFWVRRG